LRFSFHGATYALMNDVRSLPDWREAAAAEYGAKRADLLGQRSKAERAIERMQKRLVEIEENIDDLDRGAKAFGLPVAATSATPNPLAVPPGMLAASAALSSVGAAVAAAGKSVQTAIQDGLAGQDGTGHQFKDVALDLLAEVYPKSLKAAEVQHFAQIRLGRNFHWKTAGMTLYRLKNEYKVQRRGQNWFFVPENEREHLRMQEAAVDVSEEQLERDADFDAVVSSVGDLPAPRAQRWSEILSQESDDPDLEHLR